MAITKISPDVVDFDSALVVSPTLTIGDATAEDTKIVFDGNAQDYYVGLDDSADDLVIGLGSTVGTTPAIVIDENLKIGVGTTPDYKMHIFTSDSSAGAHANADDLFIESSGSSGLTIGSGTTSNGSIFFSDSDSSLSGQIEYRHNGDSLYIYTGAASRLRIDSDGLKFGNDTAAANALDDYEEGTWTPIWQGLTSNGSTSWATQIGSYTKVGRLVVARFYFGGTWSGNYGGGVIINGLPFTANDNDSWQPIGSYNVDTNGEAVYTAGTSGQTYVKLYVTGTGTAWGALNWSNSMGSSGGTSYFTGTISYFTAQ